MKVHLCGQWDGANLWLQWEDAAPDAGYRLRVRAILPKAEAWRAIGGLSPLKRPWMVLPMWSMHATPGNPGATVEAQVAVAVASAADGKTPEPEWVQATEVTFARSRCQFEFTAGPRGMHFPKDAEFSCIVDGAGAHYALQEELELAAGEMAQKELVAAATTGYCQLDRPDHFVIRPGLGSVIRNVAPSEDDVVETGATASVLRVMPIPPDGAPLKMVFGNRLF